MIFSYWTIEEILRLHFQVIDDFGGSHGVRDEGRLKSVVEVPRQDVFGKQQYKSVFEKAGVYLRNIIGDHPFSDGNKRTAITVCAIFLTRNGSELSIEPKELEDFTMRVAVDRLDISEIAAWLKAHCT